VVAAVQVTGPSDLPVGESATLMATAVDARGTAIPGMTFTWGSSDAERAAVTTAGVMTVHAEGAVTVTAATADASGSAEVRITPSVARITMVLDSRSALRGSRSRP
jgi:uncharacterized protein YjdB